MSLLTNMPHVINVLLPTHQRDPDGIGDVASTEVVQTAVTCWIQNASRREMQEYDQRRSDIGWKVFFSTDVTLNEEDILLVTTGPSDILGGELKVLGYSDRSAGLGRVYGAIVERER